MKRAMIGMSGGVDSSVAAYLTKQAGYDCLGMTMRLYDHAYSVNYTPNNDAADAQRIAEQIGIPFQVFDLQNEFRSCVINRFIQTYEDGATPNPCIDCNKHMKFGKAFDLMDNLGIDYVVTGHYAQIGFENGRWHLKKGLDHSKDQSYFLYNLTQAQLARTLFPLGSMSKAEVREIAEEQGFITARKRDSQDICFVPDGDYVGFIERCTGKSFPAGDFVDQNDKVLGKHKGFIRYTVGQRKGLGLALPAPMYVKEKDVVSNKVILCSNDELFSTSLDAKDFNWSAIDCPNVPIRCCARVRYKHTEQPAIVTPTGPDTVHIEFETPVRAISKGQAVVLYDGDIVIGGGTIV